jgi:hypothetical protein
VFPPHVASVEITLAPVADGAADVAVVAGALGNMVLDQCR